MTASGMTLKKDPDETIITRRSLHGELVSRIREEIIEGHWAPGLKIPERVFCDRFGVSRTPLREALKVLALEGLVDLLPNRGAVITEPTPEDTDDKFRILASLECLAIDFACQRASEEQLANIKDLHGAMMRHHADGDAQNYYEANDKVHRAIVLASHNDTLENFHTILSRHVRRMRNVANFNRKLSNRSMKEHKRIVAALMKRDRELAVREMEIHMADVRDRIGANRK